jgi:hypothetical protein
MLLAHDLCNAYDEPDNGWVLPEKDNILSFKRSQTYACLSLQKSSQQ